jgi:N-succinyldiaminopimelate aminotransferase
VNPELALLHPYPFQKLASLLDGAEPPADLSPIRLSIGEPQHAAPDFVREALAASLDRLSSYPSTRGLPALRCAIADWLEQRFAPASVDPEREVLPVNGTREALFAFTQAVVARQPGASVICPNPFYQIYEGAALLAGATPHYLNCTASSGLVPDFDAVTPNQWDDCQLLFLCNPGNPSGAVLPMATLKHLIGLARRHDFIIASDECYSEIYPDESKPPPGLLQACAEIGQGFDNCVVFHSLSKRSNLPGLRSGFVAGDASVLQQFLTYRTYHGCAMPEHHQLASIAAWNDEQHARDNRSRYREKFDAVLEILSGPLNASAPDAGFYLWPEVPDGDEQFARSLFESQHVTVLPGSYLGRECAGINPGSGRIRLALVAEVQDCVEAAMRIARHLQSR